MVRGTRTVAQDVVCPRRGLRRYVTLTQDIDPPQGVRHIVAVLYVVGSWIMDILPVAPRRGATICHIDILNIL